MIVPFSFDESHAAINEGDFVQVTCNVKRGDLPLKISWSLKGDAVSSEPSITTTMVGPRTSFLMISSVSYRHSGEYTCRARNNAGTQFYSTTLKVNGTVRKLEGKSGLEFRHWTFNILEFPIIITLYLIFLIRAASNRAF